MGENIQQGRVAVNMLLSQARSSLVENPKPTRIRPAPLPENACHVHYRTMNCSTSRNVCEKGLAIHLQKHI